MVWAARGEIEFVIAVYTVRSDIPQSPLALGWLCHNTIDGRSAPAFSPIFHILCLFVFATGSGGVLRTRCQIWCTIELQRARFQSCSQSGKNGSKHPRLSISMACNVISCKKLKETLKKSKSVILLCKFGSWAQKWPKIAKKQFTQSRFTRFFV